MPERVHSHRRDLLCLESRGGNREPVLITFIAIVHLQRNRVNDPFIGRLPSRDAVSRRVKSHCGSMGHCNARLPQQGRTMEEDEGTHGFVSEKEMRSLPCLISATVSSQEEEQIPQIHINICPLRTELNSRSVRQSPF